MKPIIGVIPLYDDEKDSIWMLPGYLEGIKQAGGIPITLPLGVLGQDLIQLLDLCNGFLFTGGHDVSPELYNESPISACGKPNKDRDNLEQSILSYALQYDIPVLGICRGIQLINVLLGGSLYQDLPLQHKGTTSINHHMEPPYDIPCHKVKLLNPSPLYQLLHKNELSVNSYHHQGIKRLSPVLKPMAISEDGLIEGVFHPQKKYLQAIQWHPEFMYDNNKDEASIFRSFLLACF